MKSASRRRLSAAVLAGVLAAATPAVAQDLFGVTVVDGDGNSVTVTGSSLADLAENVINQQEEFERFENIPFTGSLDYAGLDDAIIISREPAFPGDESIRVRIPSTGFDRRFADEEAAEDFLRQDGAQTVAEFISVVNAQTLVGVTDGNPAAATALMADDAFRNFGEFRNPFVDYSQGNDALRLSGTAGVVQTDVGDGTLYTGALTGGFKFSDRVGLVVSFPGGYREIEGTQAFFGGAQLGVPIQLTPRVRDGQPVKWQLTPYGLAGVSGSVDQISGGVILGGGVVNYVGLTLGDLTVGTAQQLVGYGGTPVEYDDYRFETEVGQTLARISLQATYGGQGQTAYLTGGIAYTQFLDDAAVENWLSPMVGLGLRLGASSVFRLGYRGDFGDGYDAHRGEVELRIGF